MATEDAERSPQSPDETGGAALASDASDTPVTRGRYSWRTLLTDRDHADAAEALYADIGEEPAVPASAVAAHAPDADAVVPAPGVHGAFVAEIEHDDAVYVREVVRVVGLQR
jgi:flagellar protein FlaI